MLNFKFRNVQNVTDYSVREGFWTHLFIHWRYFNTYFPSFPSMAWEVEHVDSIMYGYYLA